MKLTQVAELRAAYGRRVAFAPDGSRWASADRRAVHLWRDLDLEATVPVTGDSIDHVRFSTDGKTLLAAPWRLVVESRSWEPLPPAGAALEAGLSLGRGESFAVHASAWTPEGEELLVYGEYQPPRTLGVETQYEGETKRLLVLAGRTREQLAVLWEKRTWESYRALDASSSAVAAGAVAIGVWERGTWRRLAELTEHENGVRELRFSPDGNVLASVGADRLIAVWDISSWTKRHAWRGHDDDIWGVDVHPTLPLVATASWDGTTKLWTYDGDLAASATVEGGADGVAFSPAGDRLVVARRGSSPALVVFGLDDG